MGNSPSDSPVPFGESEALRLAQLQTARAMAERRVSADGRDGADAAQATDFDRSKWSLLPSGFKPHAWQLSCLERWLPQGRGTVKVATGGGKTKFALLAAQELQRSRVADLRLVIVVPTVPLLDQWRDELLEGEIAADEIGLLGGGSATPDLSSARVVIAVINSARDRLPKLVADAGWSSRMLLVVDECHRANAAQAQRIFDTKPAFTLGLSATPEQELDDDQLPPDEAYAQSPVGQALGPIIFEFSLRESVAAGLVTPFEIWHIGVPLDGGETIEHHRLSDQIAELRQPLQAMYRKARSSQHFIAWCQTQAAKGGGAANDATQFIGLANLRKRLLYRAKSRVAATVAVLRQGLADADGRAIVFHESIDDTELIYGDAIAAGLPAVLEHSQLPGSVRDENINLFRRGVARVIVSAKSLIEGFNVPSADLGVIAASTGSPRQRIQSLGRMLRRKASGRTARIVVLYVKDSEDESIYERADWASIVGAERNRYFEWSAGKCVGDDWLSGLVEVDRAPRSYRPPSHEVDVAQLEIDAPYPGQVNGVEIRIDQQSNARDEASAIVPLTQQQIAAVIERNELRRARATPAGHLIVRVDRGGASEPDWRFIGTVAAAGERASVDAVRLKIKQSGGRRQIAHEGERGSRVMRYALSSEFGASPEADRTRRELLEWIAREETTQGVQVRELLWDHGNRYWIEIGGARIAFPGGGSKLEFKEQ
jgi:superfamily II DNA or RNA helicase